MRAWYISFRCTNKWMNDSFSTYTPDNPHVVLTLAHKQFAPEKPPFETSHSASEFISYLMIMVWCMACFCWMCRLTSIIYSLKYGSIFPICTVRLTQPLSAHQQSSLMLRWEQRNTTIIVSSALFAQITVSRPRVVHWTPSTRSAMTWMLGHEYHISVQNGYQQIVGIRGFRSYFHGQHCVHN